MREYISNAPHACGELASVPVGPRLPERVIAIMAYTRGGSGLWASLFDSHPNVLSFPDNTITNYYWFWERYGELPAGEIVEAFVRFYAAAFDARDNNPEFIARFSYGEYLGFCNMGEDRDEYLFVDKNRFIEELKRYFDFGDRVTRKLFFQAVHLAYAAAQGRRVADPVIVWGLHVENYNDSVRLLDDFPRTVFLQTARHPVDGLASWYRHFVRSNGIFPGLFVEGLRMVMETGFPTQPSYEKRWVAVRLEDVHRYPEKMTRNVAAWLGLRWDNALLESTFNGKKWWNEKNTMQVSGFNPAIVSQRFEEVLSRFDRWRLTKAMRFRLVGLRYEKPPGWRLSSALRERVLAVLYVSRSGATMPRRGVFKTLAFFLLLIPRFRLERVCLASDPGAPNHGGPLHRIRRRLRRHAKNWLLWWQARGKLMRAFVRTELVDCTNLITAQDNDETQTPLGKILLTYPGTIGGNQFGLFQYALRAARGLMANGDPRAAIEIASVLIDTQPTIVDPYEVRAAAYLQIGLREEAASDLAKIGRESPN